MATAQELARDGRRESLDPRAARTRAAILEAAHALAAEGAGVPNVRGITQRAGLSRSSFYTQFASMEDLSLALFEDAVGRITDEDSLARLAGSAPAAEVLRASVRRFVDDVDALRHLYLMDVPETSAAHLRLSDELARALRGSHGFAAAARHGIDVAAAASFLAGATLCLLRHWVTGRVTGTSEELTDQLMLLLPPWLSEDADGATAPPGDLR